MLDTGYKICYLYDTNSYKAVCKGEDMIDKPDGFIIKKGGDATYEFEGRLLLFSTKEKAENFVRKIGIKDGNIVFAKWESLARMHKGTLKEAWVDHTGNDGLCKRVPLF